MIETGTLLENRYRVVRQIGQGGMGAVYIATDERFRSTVAIKQTFFDDPVLRRAFEREAILLNHLRHHALPRVSDHFTEAGGQFLVMEYIEGLDFSELLQERNGAFPLADVLGWADELLDALEYLHAQEPPVIHRDIKPQNLKLTTQGKVVLLDFGLAKGAQAQTHAGEASSVFGYSRNYAPLEQIQGTGTDPRSDLYSLGATLYHLLTGAAPIDALTRASALVNHQPDPLRPAHLVHVQVPAPVGKCVHRAMSQQAALRPSTAAEMRAALRQAARSAGRAPAGYLPSVLITRGRPASEEATVLGTLTEPPGDFQHDAARPTAPQLQSPTAMRETTLVDGDYGARARAGKTYAAPAPFEPPAPPARRSHKLLAAAVIALVIACASVPLLLNRRPGAPPAEDGTRIIAQPETTADEAPHANAPAATSSGGMTPSAADSAPTATQGQTARPAGETPTNNTQTVTGDSATTGAGQSDTPLGGNEDNGAAAGRPALVINEPAAGPTTGSNRTGYEEQLRRIDEEQREQMRPAQPVGGRNPAIGGEHRPTPPPPGGERRPPLRRPPPFP